MCSFEIDAYRKRALASDLPIRFDSLHDAPRWRLTQDQAARRLHALHGDQLFSGIPAFRALWGEIPHLRWRARLTGRPLIGYAAITLYDQLLAPLLYWMHARRQNRQR